ncbi:MAG TPA: ABC transporter ATP-binding protein [Acidimicrobiales bacterium]|nr:ABC transporter ATP-binding protein [Acidimicrobiales bacterium]
MTPRLQVADLTAGYREPIVSGVDFSVNDGEVFAIVGANGAGKSTILKTVMGQARAHSGKVFLEGENVTSRRGDFLSRKGVGYVPQLHDVFPGLSVLENLKMGGYLLERSQVPVYIERAFARFPQLYSKRHTAAQKLSGGERKQLALSRALMVEPKLLLLDEPTSNLAPKLAQELLREQLPQLASEGLAIVVVEQRVEAVLVVADQACLVGSGRMLRVGTAEAILDVVRTNGLLAASAAVNLGDTSIDVSS